MSKPNNETGSTVENQLSAIDSAQSIIPSHNTKVFMRSEYANASADDHTYHFRDIGLRSVPNYGPSFTPANSPNAENKLPKNIVKQLKADYEFIKPVMDEDERFQYVLFTDLNVFTSILSAVSMFLTPTSVILSTIGVIFVASLGFSLMSVLTNLGIFLGITFLLVGYFIYVWESSYPLYITNKRYYFRSHAGISSQLVFVDKDKALFSCIKNYVCLNASDAEKTHWSSTIDYRKHLDALKNIGCQVITE